MCSQSLPLVKLVSASATRSTDSPTTPNRNPESTDDGGYRRQSSRRAAATGGNAPYLGSAVTQPSSTPVAEDMAFPPVQDANLPLGTKAVVKHGDSYTPIFVDLARLDMTSLQRYVARYKLTPPVPATKADLVALVSRHFVGHPHVREPEVIAGFLHANAAAKRILTAPVVPPEEETDEPQQRRTAAPQQPLAQDEAGNE